MTVEDYVFFHNEHCPRVEDGTCTCWLPEVPG